METVTDPQGGLTRYIYDAAGNLSSVVQTNGTVTTYGYDLVNRVALIETKAANGALLASYAYTRDAAGHVMRVVEAPGGRSVDYTYDALYRLTSETVTEPGQATQATVYTYDAAGNRLSKQNDQEITTYTYDANDRLTRKSTAGGEIIYSYDDNGNLVHKSGPGVDVTYQYDSRNRLLVMRSGADEVVYTYDADGNRIRMVVNGTEITNFLVDKNGPLSQVLLETDGQGAVAASYVYGNDLISMQGPSQDTHYYHYDGQMSTRQLSDATGAVSDQYAYDAFGNLGASTGTTTNRFMYTGEEYDPNLEMYYLRARYYDTMVGRFTTRDPAEGFDQENPAGLQRYLYGRGDPINNWDPTGKIDISLSAISVIGAVLVSLVGLIGIGVIPVGSAPGQQDMAMIGTARAWAIDMAANEISGASFYWNYWRWFGNTEPVLEQHLAERHVVEGWDKIYDAVAGKRIEYVRYGNLCWRNWSIYAYVFPNDGELKIFLCDTFFRSPLIGRFDTQAGTLVHELSHELHNTSDASYGIGGAQRLARTDPLSAIGNADNYEYHGEDNYAR